MILRRKQSLVGDYIDVICTRGYGTLLVIQGEVLQTRMQHGFFVPIGIMFDCTYAVCLKVK